MATNSTSNPLPNPFTPLAFLPANVALQYQLAVYVTIATLSAFIWDWLMSIAEEIAIVRRRRFRLPMLAYFFSRIGTLGCCTLSVAFLAAPLADCSTWIYAIGGCFVVALTSTSALFFFRVKAVYCDNKIITVFFGSMLIALFGASFLIPFTPTAARVGPTQRCMVIKVKKYGAAPAILNFILDTLVFFAISLRIVSHSIEDHSFQGLLKSFFRGDGLFSLSKSLLHGGQLYYCATIGINIIVVVLGVAPVSPVYATFSISNMALESSMACRVFRGIKLGTIDDADSFGSKSSAGSLHFARPVSISFTNDSTLHRQGLDISRHNHISIEIVEKRNRGNMRPTTRAERFQYHDGHG